MTREGNSIVVSTKNGFQVNCNTIREICTFRISGWYYGKTAGLLGTYNYEEHDELERPMGVAAVNSVSSKKWEFENGCRAPEYDVELLTPTDENDLFFDICKTHFGLQSSPLSACFEEVSIISSFCLGSSSKQTHIGNTEIQYFTKLSSEISLMIYQYFLNIRFNLKYWQLNIEIFS